MVTKYDIFEVVYQNRAPIKSIEVVKKLNKTDKEYLAIYKHLKELTKEKLLVKKNRGFQAETSKKAELLYALILFCLKNKINYNLILDKNFSQFISSALKKEEINSKNTNLNPRTLKKYVEILDRYGMALVISEKPLRVKVFYNVLLNNLLVYFGYRHEVITDDSKNYINEIKKELELFKGLRKKDEKEYQRIINEFEISFIYHSLTLEGNPITLPETIKILKENIIPANLKSSDVDEVRNYKQAISLMIQDANQHKPLNLQQVLDYHKLSMQHYLDIAGKIRTINVFIKNNPHFKVSNLENIKEKLEELFEKYNDFITRKDSPIENIIEFAVYFHNGFQHIHPFVDGNSRTTRLITFHLLQSKNIPVFDIPFGLLDEYLGYTKCSKKREDKKLCQTLQKIILFNLKKINKRLK